MTAPHAPQAWRPRADRSPHWGLWKAYDATVFPAPRTAFLRRPGSARLGMSVCALVRDGGLAGWGVIRPCRKGAARSARWWADGPAPPPKWSCRLCWPARAAARIFLDIPSINRDAVALARDLGLTPVFETARIVYRRDPAVAAWSGYRRHPTFELGVGAARAQRRHCSALAIYRIDRLEMRPEAGSLSFNSSCRRPVRHRPPQSIPQTEAAGTARPDTAPTPRQYLPDGPQRPPSVYCLRSLRSVLLGQWRLFILDGK